MSCSRQLVLCLLALVACIVASCQSTPPVRYANFPDAVTSLSQVDPAYRSYFAAQQGRNYSADDQRKALAAAIRTARTPVPAYVPRSAMASSRKALRKRYARRGARYAVAGRKAVRGRSGISKRTKATRRRAVAKRSTKATRRAVAKRRSSARRRRG